MRALGLVRVSLSLLRHHLIRYLGCGVVIAAATVIASAELVLFQALALGEGIDWASFSDLEEVQLRGELENLGGALIIMFLSAVAIALFLVFAGVKDLILGRHREIATLRLTGASRPQVRRLVTVETIGFAFLVAVPFAVLGNLIAGGFYRLLQLIGVFGEGLRLNIGAHPLVVAGVVALIAVVSGAAAWFASGDITGRPLVESLEPTTAPPARHKLIIRLALVASCLWFVAAIDPSDGGSGPLVLLVPLLVVVPLAALAPFIVPLTAAAVGWLLRVFFPGLGLLVAQRARRDSTRFSSTIMPIILSVGLLGGFYLGNAPDEATKAQQYEDLFTANLVVAADTVEAADAVFNAREKVGATAAARFGLSTSVLKTTDEKEGLAGAFYFTDIETLPRLLAFTVTEGTLADVDGTGIASSRGGDKVGDTITLGPTAQQVELDIVAIIDDELYEGYFGDWNLSTALTVTPRNPQVFLNTTKTVQEVQAAIPAEAKEHVAVGDRDQYITERIENRRANTSSGNIALFGTIYLMAIISMIQSALTSGASRREEFNLYKSLGLGERNIIGLVIVEAVVLALVAAILLGVSIAALYLRFVVGAPSYTGAGPLVPWALIGSSYAIAATIMCLATIGGTIYSLKLQR